MDMNAVYEITPDRPNPIGLHRVQIDAIDGTRLRVHGLEAIDGTPIVDLESGGGPIDMYPSSISPRRREYPRRGSR